LSFVLLFACAGLQPEFWWFEVVECFRRLLLASVIGIASEDSALAPVIGFLICLAFLHLFCKRPFKEEDDSSLGIVLTYALSFIFFSALLIKVDAQPQGDLERRLFGFVLLFLLIMGPGIIIINLFSSVLSNLTKRHRRKKTMTLQAALIDGTMLRRPICGTSLVKGRGTSFKRRVSVRLRNISFADDGGADDPQVIVTHSVPPKRMVPPTMPELFELIDFSGDGAMLLDEWCEFSEAGEVKAISAMGLPLAADEAGGTGPN
jgi:hypothetical protein